MYGQTDIRIHRENWFGGSPWEEDAPIDKFWEASALREVWKVKTPTLVLVGEKDERVPAPQSVELHRALKANGVDTHLYVAPREPHGWRELRHQLFKVNVELEWFEKHALGREYVWEEAPEVEHSFDGYTVGAFPLNGCLKCLTRSTTRAGRKMENLFTSLPTLV